MAPRKSNASVVSASVEDGTSTPAKESGVGIEDFALPRTMIQRLSKGVLPPNTQIQKDALLAISKSATVFVNYLSAAANENTVKMNRKAIQPKDVLDAISTIEFDSFLPRLEGELSKYNAVQCDKRNTYRRKVRDETKAKAAVEGVMNSALEATNASAIAIDNRNPNRSTKSYIDGHSTENSKGADSDGPRASKKLRRENGDASDNDLSGDEDMEEEEGVDVDEEEDSEEDDAEVEEGFESAREEVGNDGLEIERDMEVDDDDVLDDGEDSD